MEWLPSAGGYLNFYPHHIGDYMTATAHLSWLEDAAYRRLLDIYYSREFAIPSDVAQACRLVRASSKEERKAVETVLNEFFTATARGWSHTRCDEEIAKAVIAAERARVNGKKGGRPPKEKPTANPEETQSVSLANPEKTKSQAPITNPITNTNYSVTDVTGASLPAEQTKAELWTAGKSILMQAGMPKAQCGSFVGKLVADYSDLIVLEAVRSTVVTNPADPAEYLKATCQRLAGERKRPNKQEALEASNRAVVEALLQEESNDTR